MPSEGFQTSGALAGAQFGPWCHRDPPPAASFELPPRAGRVQPTRPSCSCSAESQRFGLRAGAMSRQSITLCSPVS